MNNKSIKLMLLGIALIIFAASTYVFYENILYFSYGNSENTLMDWIESVAESATGIALLVVVVLPIVGLILVIVGFCKKDSTVGDDAHIVPQGKEISEEEET